MEVNRGGYISIIQRTEVNAFRYFRLCGDLLCKWNSCLVLQFITLCEDKNIAKNMFKGDMLRLTRSNAGSVSAWDQKQFEKLLSFVWFAFNILRWAFHCFCWQGKQFVADKQFSLRPREGGIETNQSRESILYHALKSKCFDTVVLERLDKFFIQAPAEISCHSDVWWTSVVFRLAPAYHWYPRAELKKVRKSGIDLRYLACSPAGETC